MAKSYNIELVRSGKNVTVDGPGNIESQKLRENMADQTGCGGQVKKEMAAKDAGLEKIFEKSDKA